MSNPNPNIFNATNGELTSFIKALCEKKPLICIDYGEKNIGLAGSDILLMIATPIKTIEHKSFDKTVNEIERLAKDREACGIVLGLPLQMDGKEGETAKKVKTFAEKLVLKTSLPILLWDERLSTSAIQRMMINEADLSRKKRQKSVDSSAATFILQGALDAIKNQKNN